jgi:hypothetical protein
MALRILDGNQTATTLSTIVTGGAHVPAHTIVSLGAQAITDIATAVGGSPVTITGGVYLSDAQVVLGGNAPAEAVQIGGYNLADNKLYPIAVDNNGVQSVSGTVTADISSMPAISGTVTANTRSYGSAVDPMVYIPNLDIDVTGYGISDFSGYYRYISNDRWGISEGDDIQNYNPILYITRLNSGGDYLFRLWVKPIDESPIACAYAYSNSSNFPTSGWGLFGGSTISSGSLTFTLQQRELYQVTLTNSITVGSSVTIGSLPVQLSTTTIGGTARLNVTLSSATTIGATVPSYGNLYGGSDGTNLRAILVDSSGRTTVTGSVSILGTPSVTMGAISGTVTANVASTTVTVSALPSGALTTRFGSVTTANLAQISSAVTNTSRKYLLAQNISTGTVTIGIGFSPTTTQGIQLTAGSGLTFDSFVPTGAVYWLGATTGAAYTILEG